MERKKKLALKKPAITISMNMEQLTARCPHCDYLERQCDVAIHQIRKVLELQFQSMREKIRDLHRWQEIRDEAIETYYSHKKTHRPQIGNSCGRHAA